MPGTNGNGINPYGKGYVSDLELMREPTSFDYTNPTPKSNNSEAESSYNGPRVWFNTLKTTPITDIPEGYDYIEGQLYKRLPEVKVTESKEPINKEDKGNTLYRIFGNGSIERSTSLDGKSEWGRNRMLFNTTADNDSSFVNLGDAARNSHLSRAELRRWNRENNLGLSWQLRAAVRRNFNRGYDNLNEHDKATLNNMESGWEKAERIDLRGNIYTEGTKAFDDLTGTYYNSRKEYNDALRAQRNSQDNYRYYIGDDGTRKMQFKNLQGQWANLKGDESWITLATIEAAKHKAFDPLVTQFGSTEAGLKYQEVFNGLSNQNLDLLKAWAGYTNSADPLEDPAAMADFNNKLTNKINSITNPVERAYVIQLLRKNLGALNPYFSLAAGDRDRYLIQPYYDNGSGFSNDYTLGAQFKFGGRINYFDKGGSIIKFDGGGFFNSTAASFIPGVSSYQALTNKDLPWWLKAAVIGLDALIFVPGVGLVAKGASALGKIAKLGKVGKAIGTAANKTGNKLLFGKFNKPGNNLLGRTTALWGRGSVSNMTNGIKQINKGITYKNAASSAARSALIRKGVKNTVFGAAGYAGNSLFKHSLSLENLFNNNEIPDEKSTVNYSQDFVGNNGLNNSDIDNYGFYDALGNFVYYRDNNRRYVVPTEKQGGNLIYFK